MIYNDGSTTTLYYYVLNAQGDVIALLNSAGALVASYNYGAWGNYSVHDDKGAKITKASFIGHINPFATVAITTTAKRASTTSRAGTTTLPTAGSLTPTGYLQMGLLGQICLHIVRTIL